MLLIIGCSLLYGFMQILMGTITKINKHLYKYEPLTMTLLYIFICFPIIICYYVRYYNIKNALKITKNQFTEMSIAGLIYAIEIVFIFWALLYVPLSFYTIGRTCTAFINVPFSKYYLKKPIKRLYYVGLIFLLISYVLFLMGNKNNEFATEEIISILLIFLSGLTSAIYNNMGEKYFDNYDRTHEMKIIYQIYFNVYGFLILVPIALIYAIIRNDATTRAGPNILYLITGLFYQTYIALKIYILSLSDISGNQIITGIDLARRIIINIGAYLWLDEYYNTLIIFSNVFMGLGCLCIYISAFMNK